MTPPPPTSRSLFDKSSLHEVINRYGWSKNSPAPTVVKPLPTPTDNVKAVPESPRGTVHQKVTSRLDTLATSAPHLLTELEAAKKRIEELSLEVAEKKELIDIISQQCVELKERGDDFEQAAFKENADILRLNESLSAKDAQTQQGQEKLRLLQEQLIREIKQSDEAKKSRLDLEHEFKQREETVQKELADLRHQLEEMTSQLTVEGGASIHDSLAKYKQQAKQGAELLKQSLAESMRLESLHKSLQGQVMALEEENKRMQQQLLKQQNEPRVSIETEARVKQLENQNLILQKRLQDAEAAAANSQAAVSHAMDFAYNATQDNELMKKKLQEAGLHM
jgi:chromosome segregation ATPase